MNDQINKIHSLLSIILCAGAAWFAWVERSRRATMCRGPAGTYRSSSGSAQSEFLYSSL